MAIHQPVLLDEAIRALNITPDGNYIDGTFGQGGHTKALLKQLDSQGKVIAIDKDPTSAAYVMQNFSHDKRLKFCYTPFSQIQVVAEKYDLHQKVNGILLDLGTSATQLDSPERGFSFLKEGPLDMRMNPAQGEPASTWIKRAPVNEMINIFKGYGEERWSKRIAQSIDYARKIQSIQTTTQLAQIVKDAHPRWPKKIHPATRIFQAIRIHVNQEMKELVNCLEQSVKILAPGGRLAIITFHSLEARQVKQLMRETLSSGDKRHQLHWINTGIKPTTEEIAKNPRARSAILRVIEKDYEYCQN